MRASRIACTPVLGAALVLGACGGGTEFDPIALNQAAQQVIAAMEGSQASQSMDVLGPKMTVATAAMVAATMPDGDLFTASRERWAGRLEVLQRAARSLSPEVAAGAIIPDAILGKTFTYNTSTQQYQVSSETGAPANGIRFRLYAVTNGAVVLPLQDLGYLDFVENSATSLSLNVVVGTLLDYEASATLASTSITLAATGFISNGTTQVDFDLSLGVSGVTGVTIDYAVEVPENDIGIHLDVTGNLDLVGSAVVTITHQGNEVALEVTGGLESGPVSGTIEYNGDVVVNISGTKANPIFTSASGTPLATQEVDALEDLAAVIDALVLAFARLLYPALALLGLELFI